MKFYIFLFVQLFLVLAVTAQVKVNITWTEQTNMKPSETIYYTPNKKLLWSDFIGKPPAPSSTQAVTSSGFGYSADMKSTNGKGVINIRVYCFFNKIKSWVRAIGKTNYILEHEQHHFDATYITAYDFEEKLKTANITTENMDSLLGSIYKEANAARVKMQNDYDTQTKNGILKEKQAEWNKFFVEKLKTISGI